MDSLQGRLLVASPRLRDPNFAKSVVLLIRHGEEGALGLILNRPTNAQVRQLWNQVSETPCLREGVLHLGGPVKGPLMALHRKEDLAEVEVLPGAFFSAESEKLELLVADAEPPARFFIGYAGWGEGQLEREMGEGAWLTAAATVDHIFSPDEDLWSQVTREIAASNIFSLLNIKHVPDDPSLN